MNVKYGYVYLSSFEQFAKPALLYLVVQGRILKGGLAMN